MNANQTAKSPLPSRAPSAGTPVDFPCPKCGEFIRLTWENRGKEAACPCGGALQMPEQPPALPNRDPQFQEDGVPRIYTHTKCGRQTVMPEEFVQIYLVQPDHFSNSTVCASCGTDYPNRECYFVATGEWLESYFNRLLEAKGPNYKKLRRVLPIFHIGVPLAIAVFLPIVAGPVPWWARLIAFVAAIPLMGGFLNGVVKYQLCKRGFF